MTTRTATAGVSPMIWDPDLNYNNRTTGGAGVWDLSSQTRFDPLPTLIQNQTLANTSWNNVTNQHDIAVFGGNPGTGLVTLGANIAAGGLQFDMSGYQLSGSTLTLTAPSGAVPNIEIRDGTATINSVLAGSGFTKNGPGTLVLGNANNAYNGPTTITGGAIQIFADGNLGIAPPSPTPGMLALNGGTVKVANVMTLNANRGISLSGTGGTFDVAPGGSLIYAGIIEGAGALTKTNSGTLTLSGNNSFGGGTTIAGGTLINNGSLASTVTVTSGRLSGGGSINAPVVIGDGVGAGDALLQPASAGVPVTMPMLGLSLNSDAAFVLTLDSTHLTADQLFMGGMVTLGNGIALFNAVDVGNVMVSLGTTFTIVNNTVSTTTGFFKNLPPGSTFSAGSNKYEIDYHVGPTSNNVSVKVVPEPSTSALLAAALLIAGGSRRARLRGKRIDVWRASCA